jgi:hypothetical protein
MTCCCEMRRSRVEDEQTGRKAGGKRTRRSTDVAATRRTLASASGGRGGMQAGRVSAGEEGINPFLGLATAR